MRADSSGSDLNTFPSYIALSHQLNYTLKHRNRALGAAQDSLFHYIYDGMFFYLNPQRHPLAFTSIITCPIILVAMLLNSTWLRSLPFLSLYNDSTPIVTNSNTGISYRGTSVNGIEHFQNIFYAEDTSGSNRFAPPVTFTPPRGTVVDATTAGAWCPQGTGGPPLPFTSPIDKISENCLSLRVARPSGIGASAKLPVLVWIHGGIESKAQQCRSSR